MTGEEIKDLFRYFRLDADRDDEDLTEEEYIELEALKQTNPLINALENTRHLAELKRITDEEYDVMRWKIYNLLVEAIEKQENKKTI